MKQHNKFYTPHSYYKDGALVNEINPTYKALNFLYTNFLGKLVRRLITRRWICRLSGWFYNQPASVAQIKPFIDLYNIDMTEFEVPMGGYKTFNEFFIRPLRLEARYINYDPCTITSPADSKLYVIPDITENSIFFVKHKPFNLQTFFRNKKASEYYEHGTLLIFRLAPYDYHRFHFPVDCTPTSPSPITGRFESVNPLVFKSGTQPLLANERQVVYAHTKQFGTIAMIAVGATMVGKIVHTFVPHSECKKGSEAGYFAFGGSTVVLVFKHNVIKPLDIFTHHSLQGYETAVKMGESVGELWKSTHHLFHQTY